MNNKTYIESIIGLYNNDFSGARNIEYSVNNEIKTAVARSETENRILSISFGAGSEFALLKGATSILSATLDFTRSAVDGYVESGAGSANLSVNGRKDRNLVSSVNLSTSMAISQRSGVLLPQFDIAWKHNFYSDAGDVSGAFAVDVANTGFSFETEGSNSDYIRASTGFSYVVAGWNTRFVFVSKKFAQGDLSEYIFQWG